MFTLHFYSFVYVSCCLQTAFLSFIFKLHSCLYHYKEYKIYNNRYHISEPGKHQLVFLKKMPAHPITTFYKIRIIPWKCVHFFLSSTTFLLLLEENITTTIVKLWEICWTVNLFWSISKQMVKVWPSFIHFSHTFCPIPKLL